MRYSAPTARTSPVESILGEAPTTRLDYVRWRIARTVEGHHCLPPWAVGVPVWLRLRAIWPSVLPAARWVRMWSTSSGVERRGPARRLCRRAGVGAGAGPVLCEQALELVGGDQLGAPGHLDGLEEWQDPAVEGGAADPERLGGLGAGVGEPLDAVCLLEDRARRCRGRGRLQVAASLGSGSAEAAARHVYSVQKR